jgi:hydrogenase maturation protease
VGTRVVGVGAALCGDDSVGLAVVARLRANGGPRGVSLHEVADPSALLNLLETDDAVVIVDAVVGPGPVGEVVQLDPDRLGAEGDRPASSHGFGVLRALALARAVFGGDAARDLRIVGVRIAPAVARGTPGLSPPVEAAVERAADVVRAEIALRSSARASASCTRGRGRGGTRARARSA